MNELNITLKQMRKRVEYERKRIEKNNIEKAKKEQIEKEKMDFLETYSKELYKELSSKGERNEPIIYTITKLLLNPNPLYKCEEYQMLRAFIQPIAKEKTKENGMYLFSILGCIIQVYQKVCSYDMATQIQKFTEVKDPRKHLVMQ